MFFFKACTVYSHFSTSIHHICGSLLAFVPLALATVAVAVVAAVAAVVADAVVVGAAAVAAALAKICGPWALVFAFFRRHAWHLRAVCSINTYHA